jgi:hypothetical protein
MLNRSLKALHFVKEGEEYQVIGIYRNVGLSCSTEGPEYMTVVLDHGTDYQAVKTTLDVLADDNGLEPFDFVSVPLNESLVKLQGK